VLDLEEELGVAVRHFWQVRKRQQKNQGIKSGKNDAGSRAAVTGGKHGHGFISLLGKILHEAGIPDPQIFIATKRVLPSYFRASKDWDLIAKVGNDLIAVIEVKSQVGSFGNNFNNRVEEALGSATDFWAAYEQGTFKPSARPWLGYLVMLEHHAKSVRPGRPADLAHYPMRPEFRRASYAKRYEIFCERLVRERLYDAACLVMSSASEGLHGKYSAPNEEIGFRNFASSLAARAAAFSIFKKSEQRG
jgi:hypothetical protein